MPRLRRKQIEALADLGFTRIEAEVYLQLTVESPATGYRIAQMLGKPAAQVYRTIESLERKGAVIVHDGESRLCRPVDISELVATLQQTTPQVSVVPSRPVAWKGSGHRQPNASSADTSAVSSFTISSPVSASRSSVLGARQSSGSDLRLAVSTYLISGVWNLLL